MRSISKRIASSALNNCRKQTTATVVPSLLRQPTQHHNALFSHQQQPQPLFSTTTLRNNSTNSNNSNNSNNNSNNSHSSNGGDSKANNGTSFVKVLKITSKYMAYALMIGAVSYVVVEMIDDSNQAAALNPLEAQEFQQMLNKQVQAADLPHEKFMIDHSDPNRKPRLVIIGTGWGAISLLQSIDHTKYEVIVVSPRNYFLFTPMLPSTTTGAVDYRSIVDPVRAMIYRKTKSHDPNFKDAIHYYEAKCNNVDHTNNTILCDKTNSKGTMTIEYDKLVISVGATVNTFGTKGVEENCHYLKEVEHARNIRKALMTALEKASYPETSEDEKRRLLHFAIVGGGPSGIELSAELNDFLVDEVEKFYPHLRSYMQISIVEMMDHILNTFDKKLSEYTEKKFARDRINLITNNRVLEVREKELVVFDTKTQKTSTIPYGVCVWSTGVKQQPLIETIAKSLPNSAKHMRALVTNGFCVVQDVPQQNIYAIGDCSRIEQQKLLDKMVDLFREADEDKDGVLSMADFESLIKKRSKEYPQLLFHGNKVTELYEKYDQNKDGKLDEQEFKALLQMADNSLRPLPATAQVASQEGVYLADHLNKVMSGDKNIQPFVYSNWGSFAFIGGKRAVADIPVYKSGGFLSFVAYKSVYWQKQVSWKNRFALGYDWMKTVSFGRDISKM